MTILFVFLFFYKPGSSHGRLLIYSISSKMLEENWQYGIGFGKFKAHYNEYQADYFKTHSIDGNEALIANNTFYAFNDYLQWFIETGVPGLLLMIAALFFLVKRIVLHCKVRKPLLISAGGSLVCISIAALFSYPMQVMQIQFLTMVCTGIVLFYPLPADDHLLTRRVYRFVLRFSYSMLCLYFLVYSCFHLRSKTREKIAFELARAGNRSAAIEGYKALASSFPVQGYNIYLYAEQLYFLNRVEEAEDVLAEAMTIYVDNKVYKLKATIENELGQYMEAEKNYLRAVYMVPNRMGSRVDLLNFYLARKDSSQAICWAKSILQMHVKVPSAKTENMLQRTRSLLEKLQE